MSRPPTATEIEKAKVDFAAAKSPADGYTIVMGTVGTHSINGSLYKKMPYDMTRDFAPISLIANAPNLLVVNNDLPVKTVPELIQYMKANPNKLMFGAGGGTGSSLYFALELLRSKTGMQVTVVNCRFLKPHDEATLAALLQHHRQVLVVEEGTVVNGFGSYMASVISGRGH